MSGRNEETRERRAGKYTYEARRCGQGAAVPPSRRRWRGSIYARRGAQHGVEKSVAGHELRGEVGAGASHQYGDAELDMYDTSL